LAIFAAIRRASSLVSSLVADLRPTDGRDDVRQIGGNLAPELEPFFLANIALI